MVNSWKIAFATMVIFGCGVITGALVIRHQPVDPVRPLLHSAADPARPMPAYQLQKVEFLRKIEKRLDLTSEQKDRIVNIMHQSQERTKPLWDQIAPQMRRELKRVREEIRAELTPEQQKKFEALLKPHSPRKQASSNEEKRRRSPQIPQSKVELPDSPQPPGSTN